MITEEDVTKMDLAAESLRSLNEQMGIAVVRCADLEDSLDRLIEKMERLRETSEGMTFAGI